ELAKFGISSLLVTPVEVVAGESIDVSADVTNIGVVEGIYEVVLTVDNKVIDTKNVGIAGRESEEVLFHYITESIGLINIELNGLTETVNVLTPARFEVKALSVEPRVVLTGQETIVTANISNIEETRGNYTAVLKVDGVKVKTKHITITGSAQETVTFTLAKEAAGTYEIDVGGAAESLTVLAVKTYTSPTYNFYFSYPAQWDPDIGTVTSAGFHYQKAASIGVIGIRPRADWGEPADLETVLPIWGDIIRSSIPGYQELSRNVTTHNNIPAYLVEFTSLWKETEPESKSRGKMIIMVDGSLSFVVLGIVQESDYETYWPVVETSMKTFQPPPPSKILFTSLRDGNWEIYVVNDDGSNQTRLTDNLSDDSNPAWSSDGNKIAFQSTRDGNWEIYVMDADGSNQTRLTRQSGTDEYPVWSPDGSKIAFKSMRDGNWEIYITDINGSNQKRLTDNSEQDTNPVWSPDGSKIAFQTMRDGNWEIYVMDMDGSDETRLTNNSEQDTNPVWSPDGGKIAFQSTRDGNWEIYVMEADGSDETRLTDNSQQDTNPVWSPDGARIAFTSDRPGNWAIYVMNADGSNMRRPALEPGTNKSPAWSPYSTRIAFVSDRDGNEEIYVMDFDGGNQLRLTDNYAEDSYPAWR
ncbi:DUF5050 domain-containing protein, partial [Chloroflexota bacterium]